MFQRAMRSETRQCSRAGSPRARRQCHFEPSFVRWNLEGTPAYLSGAAQRAACQLHTPSPMSSPALARITVRLASVLVLTAASLSGQQTVPPAATAVPSIASLPASAADTFELILASRALDTVRREKDRFLGERRDAEARWAAMRDSADRKSVV